MASNQELQEDFSQDVRDDQHFNGDEASGENGTDNGTENGTENGNGNNGAQLDDGQQGEAPSGRDDDRLVEFFSFISSMAANCNFRTGNFIILICFS